MIIEKSDSKETMLDGQNNSSGTSQREFKPLKVLPLGLPGLGASPSNADIFSPL